jgi:hypothetical protein
MSSLSEKSYWAVLLSVGFVIVSGFILNALASLTRTTWELWSVIVAACVVVGDLLISTRRSQPHQFDGGLDPKRLEITRTRSVDTSSFLSVRNVSLLICSAILLLSALWLSEVSVSRNSRERIVQLSLLKQSAITPTCRLEVGNYTGSTKVLKAQLFGGTPNALRQHWTLRIRDQAQWSTLVSCSDPPVLATVSYLNVSKPIATVTFSP